SPAALEWARPDCERIFAGKRGGRAGARQEEIDATLVRLGRAGKTVVRLKGGDPFIFGRGGEEAAALAAAGVPFAIVPGVTAAVAAGAYAGIPLTHRAHSSAVVFLTGHEDPAKPEGAVRWEDYARLGATLCIYMGVHHLEAIARRLQAGGLAAETPAALIHAATTAQHRTVLATLGTMAARAAEAKLDAPCLAIVGEVAGLAGQLAWYGAARQAAGRA
ncbi:MAG TPA: uroporphyrinogen-III C-methyltransferase, partial [Opitutaceae bacterium]|nr:uroporphyrinogen-III C-methyltransferase [Opitutaceae bacterium]